MTLEDAYNGLWASVNHKDDTTVTYLFYLDSEKYLKRSQGEWIPVDALDDDNTDGDLQVAVTDAFVAVFDKALEDGQELTIDDAEKYSREIQSPDSVTAAGGLDRNRGNAERLRRYWVHGEGAAKIRWGTPGDWDRCVRHLSKYLGVRAKGYCQLRHKEALGIYTATHAKRDRSKNFNLEDEFTQVTEQDMTKTIGQLFFESDDLFDDNWEPDNEIIIILEEASNDDSLLQEDSE